MSSGRAVDYESAAARYHQGRGLSGDTLDRWRRAVVPHLPRSGPRLVIDVGAGTGLFLSVWRQWGAVWALGVEPSAAMREQAARSGALAEASMAAGVAEQLPVRDDAAAVVWMSAVWHHLADRPRAVAEVARVLGDGGVWLLRGFFSDRSTVGWLDWFPGAERARGRFPSAAAAVELAAGHGFELRAAAEVVSESGASVGAASDWVRAMRSADTMLCALTDQEIAAGLDAMAGHRDEDCGPTRLTLLAFGLA